METDVTMAGVQNRLKLHEYYRLILIAQLLYNTHATLSFTSTCFRFKILRAADTTDTDLSPVNAFSVSISAPSAPRSRLGAYTALRLSTPGKI